MKNTTMIFIDKLQKHIKNKKYIFWVEWDFEGKVSHGNLLKNIVFGCTFG